jgi:hypothetical protein
VKISSITISEGVLYGTGGSGGVAAPAEPASGGSTAPVTPSRALTPSAGLAPDLYAIPITIVVSDPPAKSAVFVRKIQRAQRLMLVNSITLSAAPPSSTISGYLFVVSDGLPVTPVTPPGTGENPDPNSTATPSPTDSATPAPTGEPTPTPTGTPAS